MKYVNIYIKPDNSLVTGLNHYDSPEEAALNQKIPYLNCRYYGSAFVRSSENEKETCRYCDDLPKVILSDHERVETYVIVESPYLCMQSAYREYSEKINFCPMCGRKL